MARAALATLVLWSVACGYHLAARSTLPGGGDVLRLLAPDVTATDHPQLATRLAAALTHALGARGLSVAPGRHDIPTLRVVVHELLVQDVAVSGRRSAGESWRLMAEGRLVDRRGQTLWRSGAIAVHLSGPLPAGIGLAEASRARLRAALCERVASRLVAAMLSGGKEPVDGG